MYVHTVSTHLDRIYDDNTAVEMLTDGLRKIEDSERERARGNGAWGASWYDDEERQEAANRVRAALIYLTREEERD